ncbi:MAG: hypothetical protein JWP91_2041 [Fibrobacteres bacterium]|nr:hypothetical protein [Fibrobacterota bacterium]
MNPKFPIAIFLLSGLVSIGSAEEFKEGQVVAFTASDASDETIQEDTRIMIGAGLLLPIGLGAELSGQSWGVLPSHGWIPGLFLDTRLGAGTLGANIRARAGIGYRSHKEDIYQPVSMGGGNYLGAKGPGVSGHAFYAGFDGETVGGNDPYKAGLLSVGYHYEVASQVNVNAGGSSRAGNQVAALELELTQGVVEGKMHDPGANFAGDIGLGGRWYTRFEVGLLWGDETTFRMLRMTGLICYKFGLNLPGLK